MEGAAGDRVFEALTTPEVMAMARAEKELSKEEIIQLRERYLG